MRRLALALPWLVVQLAHAAPVLASDAALRFERDGTLVASLDLDTLRGTCGAERVVVERDPYYGRRKSFHACPLGAVLALGFGAAPAAPADAHFLLRARDGYTRPASAERLSEPGGYLAFADAELTRGAVPAWEPIDRRQVDPGPFYLVWSGPHQNDVHRYPWPYQLVAIERTAFERAYPHTVPRGVDAGAPAWSGFAIFRRECIACHAINGEGGRVGPDLNVPRSIVEYRPAQQIRDFIRDPQSFRYTSMPAHRHLSPEQLDALVAYFGAMKDRKHDPGGSRDGGH